MENAKAWLQMSISWFSSFLQRLGNPMDSERDTNYFFTVPTCPFSSHQTLLLQKSLTTPPAPLILIFHIRPPSKTCPGHPLKPPSPSIASVLARNLDGRRSVRRPACEPLNSTLGIFFADSHEARRMPSDVILAPGDPLRPPLTSATSWNLSPKTPRRGVPAAHHPCARH